MIDPATESCVVELVECRVDDLVGALNVSLIGDGSGERVGESVDLVGEGRAGGARDGVYD